MQDDNAVIAREIAVAADGFLVAYRPAEEVVRTEAIAATLNASCVSVLCNAAAMHPAGLRCVPIRFSTECVGQPRARPRTLEHLNT